MVQHLLVILKGMGVFGLIISMALEGSSIPFPGIIVVLAYGYLLETNIYDMVWIAFLMSLSYSLFSYIPYLIGLKLENKIKKLSKKKLKKAQIFMQKYGDLGILLSRPIAIGNYISYLAGVMNIKPIKYGILTFLGIYPWSFVMIYLGKLSKGNLDRAMKILNDKNIFIYIFIGISVVVFVGLTILKKRSLLQRDK